MTICLAAKAASNDAIVMVSDCAPFLPNALQGEEAAACKIPAVSRHWCVLFAAEKSGSVYSILRDLRTRLGAYEAPKTLALIRDAVAAAYQAEFHRQLAALHLHRFGFHDIDEFRRDGLQQLGLPDFSRMAGMVEQFDLGIEMLVCGFGPHGGAHVLSISNPGSLSDHDLPGFGAVGSGAEMARALLAGRAFDRHDNATTTYRLCDAKFRVEAAGMAGSVTSVLALNQDGLFAMMSGREVETVRTAWLDTLRVSVPVSAVAAIDATLGDVFRSRS